jgi:hypothetical protein
MAPDALKGLMNIQSVLDVLKEPSCAASTE